MGIGLAVNGCGESKPATWIARRGAVVVGVWDCPNDKKAESVLRAWLSATVPPDMPPAPAQGDDRVARFIPDDDVIPGWTRDPLQVVDSQGLLGFLRATPVEYETFGFQHLASAEYRNLRFGPRLQLRVEVYDMGTPENAFALYSQKRIPGGTYRAFGGEAFIGGTETMAWADRYYLFIKIYEYADDTREALLAFTDKITRRIGGVKEEPTLLKAMEAEGTVPRSQRWFRTAQQAQIAAKDARLLLMSLSSETRGFVAQIQTDDFAKSEAFCVVFPTETEAVDQYSVLKEALAEKTADFQPAKLGDEAFRTVSVQASPQKP
jgi:hypothetical protein